jgi:hypothetical protein
MSRRSVGRGLASWAAVATLALLLVPASAMADRHKDGAGGGGSYGGRSDLWGGTFMAEHRLAEWGNRGDPLYPFMLSLAADVSIVTGRHEFEDFTQTTALAGPRLTWNSPFDRRLEPYFQFLIGYAHESTAHGSGFAGAFGLGVDVPLAPDLRVPNHPKLVGRFQFAYHFVDEGSTSWYPQVTLGLMYRWNQYP